MTGLSGALALLLLIIVFFAAMKIGRLCLHSYWSFSQLELRQAADMAVGLAVISYGVFFLSSVGCISKATLFALHILLVPFAVSEIYALSLSHRRKPRRTRFWKSLLPWNILLGGYTVWILLCWILPETARDSLIYHLEVPRQMIKNSGFYFAKDNVYAYFPQFMEMFFLMGFGTGGELAAKIYHAGFAYLLAMALFGFSRKYLDRANSFLTVFLFLTIPTVMVIMPWAYVDLGYAFYSFLAIVFVLFYFQHQKIRWLVLGGLMAGCASAIKYTGIQFTLLLILWILMVRFKKWSARDVQGVLWFLFCSMLLFAPYAVRNLSMTGWPLFPFDFGGFALNPLMNWDAERTELYMGWLGQFGLPAGWPPFLATLTAPFLVFLKGQFHSPQFYQGVVGPVFLFIPVLWWKTKKNDMSRSLLLFCLLFLYFWSMTTKQIRFLLPALPILSLLVVLGIAQTKRVALYVLLFLFVVVNLCMGVGEVLKKQPYRFWMGLEDASRYLSRRVDGYSGYQLANKYLGPYDRVYLLNMKNYLYYLDVPARSDFVFERSNLDGVMNQGVDAIRFGNFFKEQGVTHLLVDEKFISSADWGMKSEHLVQFRSFLKEKAKTIAQVRQYTLYRFDF